MKISFYNNVAKNRRMLLERSSKDISRYTAGKPSVESLFPIQNSMQSDIPTPQNVRDLFASVFSSIEEPYTIARILEELNKITDAEDSELYDNISIIYDKDILSTKLNDFINKGLLKEINVASDDDGNTTNMLDLKEYIGKDFLDAASFNNSGKNGKTSLPSRFSNPHVAIFKIKDHSISFLKSKEAGYAPFCATVIPAIEMSRCVPHLNISIVDDDKNTNRLVSLGKFLVGREPFKTDGFAKGLSAVEFTDKQDLALSTVQKIFDNRIGEKAKQNVSGMELFQGPQSMVNSDINKFQKGLQRVANPFLPLMAIESFSINDQLKPLEFISTTSGTLSLKLFDRSRLPEISKLIGQDFLTSIFLVIEFGWSHPDGSIISGNPFGQFLDSLKRRELFVVSDSNVTVNDDGTASIKLNIVSLGEGSWKSNAMSQKYISVEDFNQYLLYFEKKIKESSNSGLRIKIKPKIISEIRRNELKVNDLIKKEALTSIGFFDEFEKIMSLDSNESNLPVINKKIQTLLNAVRTSILQFDSAKAEVEEDKTDIDDAEQQRLNFRQSLGIPEGILSESELAAIGKLVDGSVNVEDNAALEKLRNDALAVIDKAVQSSTSSCLNEIVGFLNKGDLNLVRSITQGASVEAILQKSLEMSANDTNTVIARLTKAGIDLQGTLNQQFTYAAEVQFGDSKDDVMRLTGVNGQLDQNRYISLARLLAYCYGLPSALAKKSHDEIQMFFHPANQQAGAFFNISLGDVFIDSQKYLSSVANILYRNKVSTLTCEQHLSIIRNILISKNYCLGYGISTMQTTEDDEDKTEAHIKLLKQKYVMSENEKLSLYYEETFDKDDIKSLQFKTINLKLKEETIPYADSDGLIKKIRRIHFFDGNADPYINASYLLSSLNNTSLKSVLKPRRISKKINNFYTNSSLKFHEFTSNNFKKAGDIISTFISDKTKIDLNEKFKEIANNITQVDNITPKIANEIDTILKATVPTIEFGAENGFVQSMTLSNNNGGLANKLNQMNFVTTLSNGQNEDNARNTSKLYLNPGSLSISMMGFPIITIGQTFYVTAKTNTSLDTLYRVTSVTHSISAGNFSTSVTLEATMDAVFDPVNISKKIMDIGYAGTKPKIDISN
jgi:hypothetical protein